MREYILPAGRIAALRSNDPGPRTLNSEFLIETSWEIEIALTPLKSMT